MNDKTIFTDLSEKNTSYCKRIETARISGQSQVAKDLCDEWCQFLCDSAQTLNVRAVTIEKLVERFPDYKDEAISIASSFRKYSQVFSEMYAGVEALQRKGIIPTNLSDFSRLTE